jgi:hypothetical protein
VAYDWGITGDEATGVGKAEKDGSPIRWPRNAMKYFAT